jgi:hypothetical protein
MYLWLNTLTAHQRCVIPSELTLRLDFSHQQSRDARISYDKLPALDRTPFKAVRILNWSEDLDAALHRAGTLGPG